MFVKYDNNLYFIVIWEAHSIKTAIFPRSTTAIFLRCTTAIFLRCSLLNYDGFLTYARAM